MSGLLRVEMIAMALVVLFIIVRNVNHKKLRLQYSFFWLLVALGLLVVAFFPGLVEWLCGVMQIQTPVNLIYLFGILALLLISFHQTVLLSQQADRITRLTQLVSIEKYLAEKKGEEGIEKDG